MPSIFRIDAHLCHRKELSTLYLYYLLRVHLDRIVGYAYNDYMQDGLNVSLVFDGRHANLIENLHQLIVHFQGIVG